MLKFLKLAVSGKKAVVPEPMFSREEPRRNPVRSHSAAASSSPYTNVIPNQMVSTNRGNYTPPPKNTPFAVIPKGVCKNC